MKTCSIPAMDLMHFYVASGSRASVITYEVRLKEEADRETMREALADTLQHFPYFRMRPVIQNNEIRFAENGETPIVLGDHELSVSLGEAEVHGYLFALSVKDKTVRFRVHHGLSDGRGCLVFLKALLYYYYRRTGEQIENPKGNLRTEQENGQIVPYAEKHADFSVKPFGMFSAEGEKNIFYRPEKTLPDPSAGAVFEISCPIRQILEIAKRSDTTPVPVMNVLISQAYRNVYGLDDQLICGGTAVDNRVIFKDDAINNAATSLMLPYFPRMADMDFSLQVTALRARLELEIQPENMITGLNAMVNMVKSFTSVPMPVTAASALISSKIAAAKNGRTFQTSYVGAVRLPEEIQKHVDGITVLYSPFCIPTYIMAIENDGILRFVFTQNCESDVLVREFYRLLKDRIPETVFTDKGIRKFDGFYLEHMETVS